MHKAHLPQPVRISGMALATAVFAVWAGCSSGNADIRLSDYQLMLIDHLEHCGPDYYAHIVVASINWSRMEAIPQHPSHTLYHYKGSVIRSLRGSWKVGEAIDFVHASDSPPPATIPPAEVVRGRPMLLFLREHVSTQIALDTGEFMNHEPEVTDAVFVSHSPARKAWLRQRKQFLDGAQ